MNEEQKEAIKTIESFKNMKWYSNIFPRGVEILTEEERREIDIVINLIEKQQEEIEDLKAITREYESYKVGEGNNIVIASKNWFVDGFFEEYLNKYISKDKIKEKIKYYHKQREKAETEKINDMFVNYIDCLEELLQSGQESDQEGG